MNTEEEIMEVLNVDPVTARFIADLEAGETDGDVIEVDDTKAAASPPPRPRGDSDEPLGPEPR